MLGAVSWILLSPVIGALLLLFVPASKSRAHGHAHPTPFVMQWPLGILAIFSVIAGFIGIPGFLAGGHGAEHPEAGALTVAIVSTIVVLSGIALGTLLYAKVKTKEDPIRLHLGFLYSILVQKYYLDDFFGALANVFQKWAAQILFWFDSAVVMTQGVGGAVRGTASIGELVRRAQSGHIRHYAAFFIGGVILIVFFVVMRGAF